MEKTIAQRLGIKNFPFIIKNKTGYEIYREYKNNHYLRVKYNNKNNPIYIKISSSIPWFNNNICLNDDNLLLDLYIIKIKYNEDGEEIYFEDNKGFWSKTEYFENGYKSYEENSKGIFKEYDKNGNCIRNNVNVIKYIKSVCGKFWVPELKTK